MPWRRHRLTRLAQTQKDRLLNLIPIDRVANRALGRKHFLPAGCIASLFGQWEEFLHNFLTVRGNSRADLGDALGAAGHGTIGVLLQLRPMFCGEIAFTDLAFVDGVEQRHRPLAAPHQQSDGIAADRRRKLRPAPDDCLSRSRTAALAQGID